MSGLHDRLVARIDELTAADDCGPAWLLGTAMNVALDRLRHVEQHYPHPVARGWCVSLADRLREDMAAALSVPVDEPAGET